VQLTLVLQQPMQYVQVGIGTMSVPEIVPKMMPFESELDNLLTRPAANERFKHPVFRPFYVEFENANLIVTEFFHDTFHGPDG
jgi:hypothetical protein